MKINSLKFLSSFQTIAPINELLLLLSKVTNISTSMLLIKDEIELTDGQKSLFDARVERLRSKEPLPYVLGEWGFYDLLFEVSPAVLIPRPETERIIELVLEKFIDHDAPLTFLDIGTGSGIIPITLATKYPSSKFVAVDISEEALAVAERNADRHQVSGRLTLRKDDLIPPDINRTKFDVITANLPYIPTKTVQGLDIYGIEPTIALDGGELGYELIEKTMRRIVDQKIEFGCFLLEIEYRQGQILVNLADKFFPHRTCTIYKDLAGHDRTVVIE